MVYFGKNAELISFARKKMGFLVLLKYKVSYFEAIIENDYLGQNTKLITVARVQNN